MDPLRAKNPGATAEMRSARWVKIEGFEGAMTYKSCNVRAQFIDDGVEDYIWTGRGQKEKRR